MKPRHLVLFLTAAAMVLPLGRAHAAPRVLSHPRPSGYAEAAAPAEPARADFLPVAKDAGFVFDFVAFFPKTGGPEFTVTGVDVNGQCQERYLVRNHGVVNVGRTVHGIEDFSVALNLGWEPGKTYTVKISGAYANGKLVEFSQDAAAPAERKPVKGLSFLPPSADFPYHYASLTLAKESLGTGTVTLVEVDGQRNRDARFFNVGLQLEAKAAASKTPEGESYTGVVDGSRDFQVTVPVNWAAGSQHTVKVTVKAEDGSEVSYQEAATAGSAGAFWNAEWPHAHSIILSENVGCLRNDEPVRVAIAPFADDIGDPRKELRIVSYDPTNPEAGADGYVQAPYQIISINEWRDEKMLKHEERDAETGELVHRYDPTTTVELVFLADVLPYQKKVYQILYGNPKAEEPAHAGDLKVTAGEGLSQTVSTANYDVLTSKNSGALETVTIKGNGDPVILEHKLETNGAVHWNPDFYSPPTPWVHVSDWEKPETAQVSGSVMHHVRAFAPLPHLTDVVAHVSYTFYGSQPYIEFSTLMEVQNDAYVSALRNLELVFNHAVLNEFVWLDPLGKIQSMKIEGSKLHPVHALEVPPNTPWMAFINREQKLGFASILLDYVNTNRYGDLSSQAQPYIYVQNGPWIYWSRGIVYPFAGNNMTRLMPVRKGSTYYERNAWLPFRFSDGQNPFAVVEDTALLLKHPLDVVEWMPTNKRAPEKWVMPILTMPFNEGVAGAVSAHKDTTAKEKK